MAISNNKQQHSVKFTIGNIYVPGVCGYFSQKRRVGEFMHIHHCVLNSDGVGCKSRQFVGSVPIESWEAGGVYSKTFKHDVEEKIIDYLEKIL